MKASVDTRTYETNDFAIIHYLMKKADSTMVQRIPELADKDLNQSNINAHFVKNGYWVDIHMSKIFSTPKDETLFKEFVASIRVVAE